MKTERSGSAESIMEDHESHPQADPGTETADEVKNSRQAPTQQHLLFVDGDIFTGYAALLLLAELFAVVDRYEAVLDGAEDKSQITSINDDEIQLQMTDSSIVSIDWAVSGAQDKLQPKVSSRSAEETKLGSQVISPCHYFDYFVGRGAAGLVTVMLGRLRMSLEEATKRYSKLFDFVHISQKHGIGKKKTSFTYDVDSAVDCIVHGYCRNDYPDLPFIINPGLSKTLILATETLPGILSQHLIRSYELPLDRWDSSYEKLWYTSTQKACEICLVDLTTAKSIIAGKIVVSNQNLEVDPLELVLKELQTEFGRAPAHLTTSLEIQLDRKKPKFSLPWLRSSADLERPQSKSKPSSTLSQGMSGLKPDQPDYSTISNDVLRPLIEGLQARLVPSFADPKWNTKLSLGSSQTTTQIQFLAQEYLSQKEVKHKIGEIANNLVLGRRSRTKASSG